MTTLQSYHVIIVCFHNRAALSSYPDNVIKGCNNENKNEYKIFKILTLVIPQTLSKFCMLKFLQANYRTSNLTFFWGF
jgi:hypothetical protein